MLRGQCQKFSFYAAAEGTIILVSMPGEVEPLASGPSEIVNHIGLVFSIAPEVSILSSKSRSGINNLSSPARPVLQRKTYATNQTRLTIVSHVLDWDFMSHSTQNRYFRRRISPPISTEAY